eukprot:gene1800-4904_t
MDEDHAAQLQRLKETDPEFYKFLLKEDKSLLSFGKDQPDSAEENDDSDLSESEDQNENEGDQMQVGEDGASEIDEESSQFENHQSSNKQKKTLLEKDQHAVTVALVNTWAKRLRAQPLRIVRRIVLAYSSVIQTDADNIKQKDSSLREKFTVSSPSAYNALLHLTLSQVPKFLHKRLPLKDRKMEATQLPGWKKLKNIIKVFVKATISLILQSSDANMTSLLIKTLSQAVPYIVVLPKLRRTVLKDILTVCTREESVATVAVILFLRQMLFYSSLIFSLDILKSAYMTFVRCTKFVNLNNHDHVRLFQTAVKELFLQDEQTAYQLAFIYIRQLAIYLRDAHCLKRPSAHQMVHSWQFISCLQLWTHVIADSMQHNTSSVMQTLLYPLIQVCLGAVSLLQTPRYFPFHFHLIRTMIFAMEKCHVFIPLSSAILIPLQSTEVLRKPAKRITKPLNMALTLSFPKSYIGTKPFQDAVIEEINGLMLQYLEQLAGNIGFPEAIIPIFSFFRHVLKNCKNVALRKTLKSLSDQLEANSKFIATHRSRVEHSPLDVNKNDEFECRMKDIGTPLQKFVKLWRDHEQKKRKLLMAHGEIPKDEDGIEESEIQGEADANNFAEGSENENFVWEDEVDEESDEESTVPQPKRRKTKQNKFPEQNIDEKKKKKKQKTSVVSNEGDYEQEGSDNNLDWMFE